MPAAKCLVFCAIIGHGVPHIPNLRSALTAPHIRKTLHFANSCPHRRTDETGNSRARFQPRPLYGNGGGLKKQKKTYSAKIDFKGVFRHVNNLVNIKYC